jgi:hypothetical protein
MKRAVPFLLFILFWLWTCCVWSVGKLDLDSFVSEVIQLEVWPSMED